MGLLREPSRCLCVLSWKEAVAHWPKATAKADGLPASAGTSLCTASSNTVPALSQQQQTQCMYLSQHLVASCAGVNPTKPHGQSPESPVGLAAVPAANGHVGNGEASGAYRAGPGCSKQWSAIAQTRKREDLPQLLVVQCSQAQWQPGVRDPWGEQEPSG